VYKIRNAYDFAYDKKSCQNKNVLLINIVVETHTLRIMYWIVLVNLFMQRNRWFFCSKTRGT